MAEQNETKKKPPLIPRNFNTLAQLKEKFHRERREKEEKEIQERERREREEREKLEREQREKEEEEKRRQKQEEEEKEKENQSVRRREKGKPFNRRNDRSRVGDDRRYRRKETEESEVAMVCMVTVSENAVVEAENGGFKSEMRGPKIWKRKEKLGKQISRAEDEVIEGEGLAKLSSSKSNELEVATACVVTVSENAVEQGREVLKNKRKGSKSWKRKAKRKDKARAEDEKVIGGEELALPSQDVDKETVQARRKPLHRGKARHIRSKIEDESEGQSVETSEKFGGLSMNGGSIREHTFSRDEEVIGGEELVLLSQDVDKETVQARKKPMYIGKLRHFRSKIEDESEGQSVEISEKIGGVSVNGGSRREHRFSKDEEVIGGKELPSQDVDKETVPAKRESRLRKTPRQFKSKKKDEMVEISEKIEDLPMNGGSRSEHSFSRDEEVRGGEELVLPSQNVDSETVPAKRESRRRGTPRHFKSKIENGQLVEISEKSEDLPMNGGSIREHSFSREEVIGGEELVLPSQNVDKDIVPAKRESRSRGTPRHFKSKIEDELEVQLVEISEKSEDLPMNGGNRRELTFSSDEELIGGEELVLASQGVDKETVSARRELRGRGAPRHFRSRMEDGSGGQWVEISEKVGGLSMNGERRREYRYPRPRGYSTRRNSTYGRSHGRFGDFGHRREMRDSGKVWVKKGDVGDGNEGEVQPPELLSKELD